MGISFLQFRDPGDNQVNFHDNDEQKNFTNQVMARVSHRNANDLKQEASIERAFQVARLSRSGTHQHIGTLRSYDHSCRWCR